MNWDNDTKPLTPEELRKTWEKMRDAGPEPPTPQPVPFEFKRWYEADPESCIGFLRGNRHLLLSPKQFAEAKEIMNKENLAGREAEPGI